MAVLPKCFGQPKNITKQVIQIPFPRGQGAWVYKLVRTIVWVDADLSRRVPHQFMAWYCFEQNGPIEGPLQDSEVPMSVWEIAFGESSADPLDGGVVDLES